jgi:hypothetical protein
MSEQQAELIQAIAARAALLSAARWFPTLLQQWSFAFSEA